MSFLSASDMNKKYNKNIIIQCIEFNLLLRKLTCDYIKKIQKYNDF